MFNRTFNGKFSLPILPGMPFKLSFSGISNAVGFMLFTLIALVIWVPLYLYLVGSWLHYIYNTFNMHYNLGLVELSLWIPVVVVAIVGFLPSAVGGIFTFAMILAQIWIWVQL